MTFSGHSFKDRASNQSLIEVSRHPVVNVLERRIDFGCRAGLEGLPVLDGRLSAIHEIRCALALRSSTELGRPDVAPWGFAIAMLRSRRQYPSSGKSPPKYRASLGGQSHIRVLSWLPLRVSQNEIAVVPPDSPAVGRRPRRKQRTLPRVPRANVVGMAPKKRAGCVLMLASFAIPDR
jgi:hypothetical protein